MKPKQLLILSLTFCLGLASCRKERKPAEDVSQKHNEQTTVSSPPPLQPEPHGNAQVTSAEPEPPGKHLTAPTEVRELSTDEMLLRKAEMQRAAVFGIPLPVQATKDRTEAWEKLTSSEPHTILKKEQYLYARELLERYRDAPVLERLVFWRLIYLRLHEQGVSGITRVAVGADDYQEIRRGMNPKLKTMLYSALGETPETLQEFLAIQKGLEILKVASPNGSLFDY